MIVFMDSESSSRSEGCSLRPLKKVDHNRMQKGEDQIKNGDKSDKIDPSEMQENGEGEQLENQSGTSLLPVSSGSSKALYGLDSPMYKNDKGRDELEIESIALQMKCLNAEEAR